MKTEDIRALIGIPVILLIAGLLVWAGNQGGLLAFGLPIFGLCVTLAFLIQWVVFIPAYVFQTEKFFDLTGSLTYLSVTTFAFLLSGAANARAWLLLVLVSIWALRLGTFLFTRVQKSGKDSRFDDIKPSLPRFLLTWTLQGLWVSFYPRILSLNTWDLRQKKPSHMGWHPFPVLFWPFAPAPCYLCLQVFT